MYERSAELYSRALKLFPGGVNSPVRAMRGFLEQPLYIDRAKGSSITDADGNSYIDYVCSYGAIILGHAHPAVLAAIAETAPSGTTYGAPTKLELDLAELIMEAVPSMEMLRFVNSGTEAAMSALRLARGYSGREKVVKFAGCYHGHSDSFLIEAGSGLTLEQCSGNRGITAGLAGDTLVLPYNRVDLAEQLFKKAGREIAAVIVEPLAANMGVVKPEPGFLETLRKLTAESGTVLIFDEAISGFRVCLGGAQELYGVKPDLTVLGKIIGGGLPIGAYGGKKEIMAMVAPSGPVFQAGTFAGSPLAMAAGAAALRELKKPLFYEKLAEKGAALLKGLQEGARASGLKVQFEGEGSLFWFFFNPEKITDFAAAKSSNDRYFKIFFRALLKEGIYIAPAMLEAGLFSAAHSDEELEYTVKAASKAFLAVREKQPE